MRYQWFFAFAIVAAAFHQPASAADAIVFAPAPAWVQPIAVPQAKPSDDGGSVGALLSDSQVFFGPDGDAYYFQVADQVLTTEGLDELGLISQSWDPLLDTLTIHAVEIIRDGKVIDALKDSEPFSIIRREQNLNYAMLDGRLTATKQLEDLRVGDIVRTAMTLSTKDPSLANHAEYWDTLSHEGTIARARYRYVWPKDRDLRWRTTLGFSKAVESKTALGTELVADGYDVRTPLAANRAPDRFNNLGEIEITSFKSWRELSALFAPYYVQAAALKADSPVRAEAAKIRESHSGKVAQASAALSLVEQRVRYVALTMGQAGYQPAAADLTWSRRFGDCKGKSALLIALLTELGIDAEPAIVRTDASDGLNERFPRAGLFDHVIVKVTIDGRAYWLDATRSGDTDIRRLDVPPYLWALPLRAGGADLEPLVMVRSQQPLSETTLELDQTAGLEADMLVVMTETFRGEAARSAYRQLTSMSRIDAERTLREGWTKQLPWLTMDQVKLPTELGEDGSLSYIVTGKAKSPWTNPGAGKQRTVSLGDTVFKMTFDKRQADRIPVDAPYVLSFPFFDRSTMILKLPREGSGFEVVGADVDETVANMRVSRKATLADGAVTTVLDVETLASEVPYDKAIAVGDVLARLPTGKAVVVRAPLSFASTGKEVDNLLKQRPDDAQAYLLRAEHNLAIYRPTAALADAEAALKLDPDNAQAQHYKAFALAGIGDLKGALAAIDPRKASSKDAPINYMVRSGFYLEYERYDEALADANRLVDLMPDLPQAYSIRADIHREMGQNAKAIADLQTAIKLDPEDRTLQNRLLFYSSAKSAPAQPWRSQLIDNLGGLIAADGAKAELYDERAAFNLLSLRFDDARKDYDKAITLEPTAARYLSRGGFLGSMQDDAAALADFDKAVELSPSVDSLQARAAFHASRRDFARARADLDAASKLEPDSPDIILSLALLDIQSGDAASGFARIEKVAAEDPASYERLEMKANVHQTGKAYDLAFADVTAMAARKGNTPEQMRSIDQIRAQLHSSKGEHAQGIDILSRLITKDPGNATLLNERCWARATAALDLPRAKADCDAALAMTSPQDAAPYLDSLGLVYLQLGRNAEALEVYNRVLAAYARFPTSLYGRGLAKARLGDAAGSAADMAAALKVEPDIGTEFLGYGLKL